MRFFVFIFSICCLFCNINENYANPFVIDFPIKAFLSNEDYIAVQQKLRSIDIRPLISSLYPENQGYATYKDFLARCSKGLNQTLIDPEKGFFPRQNIEKIGQGSDKCIVCCVPYDGIRSVLVGSIKDALQKTGFNGYFFYQMGGFPNPTGKEIRYAGVPYSFKIFMMLEANKLGFNNVLWIDSSLLPLRNPSPLFAWMDKNGSFLLKREAQDIKRFIFPATIQVLKDLTGTNVLDCPYICTTIFGLKMEDEISKKLIDEYYTCVEYGLPFISCFPEEFVLTAIINQAQYDSWKANPYKKIMKYCESEKSIAHAKKKGYFFYNRKH